MSLLNDMLHDLAKKTPANPIALQLIPVQKKKKNVLLALVKGVLLSVFFLSIFLFIYLKSVSKGAVTAHHEYIEAQPKLDVVGLQLPSDLAKAENDNTLSVNLESYIEPINFLDSINSTTEYSQKFEEPMNDWVELQGEPNMEKVNKVYTPQTLGEWRDEKLKKGLKAIEEGFDDKAMELFQAVLDKVPNSKVARENLVSLYMLYGMVQEADDLISEGLKIAPVDAALLTAKARLLVEQGKISPAVELLSKHRPSINKYPDYYGTLAAALQAQGHILETGSIYQALIQIDSNNGQYWLGYALFLEHTHKLNQAIEAYTRATQSEDIDSRVREFAENSLKNLQG